MARPRSEGPGPDADLLLKVSLLWPTQGQAGQPLSDKKMLTALYTFAYVGGLTGRYKLFHSTLTFKVIHLLKFKKKFQFHDRLLQGEKK